MILSPFDLVYCSHICSSNNDIFVSVLIIQNDTTELITTMSISCTNGSNKLFLFPVAAYSENSVEIDTFVAN